MATHTQNDLNLVHAVYELALNPTSLDAFTQIWEQYIQDHGLADAPDPRLIKTLAPHFEHAFELMQRSDDNSISTNSGLHNRPSPAVSLTVDGRIESFNRLAAPFVKSHASIRELVTSSYLSTVTHAVQQAKETGESKLILVTLDSNIPCLFLIHKLLPNTDKFVVDISPMDWGIHDSELLKELFGLTAKECEIAGLLFQGLTIKDIARQTNRAVDTIRKQSKSLIAKTGTHSQAKLMRLLASINLSPREEAPVNWKHSKLENRQLRLDDGRLLSYYDTLHGDCGTIIVLHGILHDPELPSEVHQALVALGYRVIGVVRAWFGDSSPAHHSTDLLDTAANDLKQLVDKLSLTSVTLIGLMAGSLHAYRFCSKHPYCVDRIINISGMVPIFDDSQLGVLPQGVRAVARSARHFPKILPTLTRAAVALLNRGDIHRLFKIGYRNSPLDLAATKQPEIFERLSRGFYFANQHGHATYTYEGIEIMRDVSKDLHYVHCPVHYIHGEQDGLTAAQSVAELCQRHPNIDRIQIADTGNLMIYSEPKLVANTIKQVLSPTPL